VQAWQFRNMRAHMYLPSENESLDALRLLADLLDQCGLKSAAQEIEALLVEARDLMKKARMTISSSSSEQATVRLQDREWEALLLYRALFNFEQKPEQVFYFISLIISCLHCYHVCSFRWQDLLTSRAAASSFWMQ